jgi:hypothetical protein
LDINVDVSLREIYEIVGEKDIIIYRLKKGFEQYQEKVDKLLDERSHDKARIVELEKKLGELVKSASK